MPELCQLEKLKFTPFGVYELASVQALKDYDGGWNASLYRDKSRWEDRCGLVPDKYRNRLKGSVENEVTPLP
jgi:hypothetical protein